MLPRLYGFSKFGTTPAGGGMPGISYKSAGSGPFWRVEVVMMLAGLSCTIEGFEEGER